MDVREATAADEREIADVERLAIADLRKVYRPTAAARQTRTAMDATLHRLVAVLDGHVVGTVQYHVDDRRLSFLGLGVHPAYRRRGVARALVRHLETIAARSGCETVTARTVRETGNVSIFEKLGFEVESEEPTPLFESEPHRTLTEVTMRKRLPDSGGPR